MLKSLGRNISLCIPYAESRPAINEKALTLSKAAKLKEITGCKITRKKLEENLVTGMVPVGILPEKQCIKVWQNVNSAHLFNGHKDLAWKIVHNCIPIRVLLKKRGGAKKSTCPIKYCNMVEDVIHCFCLCPASKAVWETLNQWLAALFRAPSAKDILYGNCNTDDDHRTTR